MSFSLARLEQAPAVALAAFAVPDDRATTDPRLEKQECNNGRHSV